MMKSTTKKKKKKKSSKKKWLLVLAALVIVGLPVSYLGGREVLKWRIRGWRDQGIAEAKAEHHPAAADLLARYLQRRPDDVEALTYYIKSRETAELPNGQHLAGTIDALKMVLSEEPDRVDDRRHLMELYAKLEHRPEAIDTANALLASVKSLREKKKIDEAVAHKNEVAAWRTQTLVMMKMRQNRALDSAKAWVAIDAKSLEAQMARLEIRQQLFNASGAEILADARESIQKDPNDPGFQMLLGYAHALAARDARATDADRQQNEKEAIKWLQTAAANPQLPNDVAKVLVEQFDQLGQSEDALGVLRAQIKKGGDVELQNALGRRFWETNRWKEAVAALAHINPADAKTDATLIAMKAMSFAGVGDKVEADACRKALADRDQAAARAWTLILKRHVDNASIDDKQLIAECRSAMATDPTNIYLACYYGDANARLGEIDLAMDAWRIAARDSRTWSLPGIRWVEAMLQKGRWEHALLVATDIARRNQTQAVAIITLARAWSAAMENGAGMATGAQSDMLLKLVTDVQRQLPGEEQTLPIQVQLLAQRNDKPAAIAAARTGITAKNPSPELLMTLAGVSRKFSLGLEEECFARSEQAHGLTPTLAYNRAVNVLIAKDGPAGLKLLDELAQRSGKSNELPWQLARVRFLDLIGSTEAPAAWVAIADANPNDLNVQQAAANARMVHADWPFQERVIERLKKLTDERGLSWRLAQARLYVGAARNAADYEKGSLLLTDLVKDAPNLSEPRVLLARALVEMKRIDGAVEQLTVASKLEPTSVSIALQLATLYQARGDFDHASEELDRIAPQIRTTDERRLAALLLAQQGSDSKAVEQLEAGKETAKTPQDQLLLARLYLQDGQPQKSEAIARKLLEKPELASVEFAAKLFAQQGRRADAEQTLAKLEGLQAAPGMKELVRGQCYYQLEDAAEAAKQFEAATKLAPQNATAWRLHILSQISTGHSDRLAATLAAAAKAVPADKSLATLNAQSALLQEAVANAGLRPMVASAVRNPQESDAALELLGVLKAARESGDREQLAARLRQIVERNPQFVYGHTQLIDCYWAMGRISDAAATAKQGMTIVRRPGRAEIARHAVTLFEGTGRWSDLAEAAETWRALDPRAAAGADMALVRADIGRKNYPAAVTRLKPYLDAAKAEPDKHAEVLSLYAVASLNAGQENDAWAVLSPLATKSPQWRMRTFTAALNVVDLARAGAWLDRVAAIIPADAADERVMLAECYERLGRDRADDTKIVDQKRIDQGKKMVREYAAKPDASVTTLLTAAAQAERIAGQAQRSDATAEQAVELQLAETFYRRALAADANLWLAQNNLAMLLVRREGDISEALRLAAAATKLQPSQPAVLDTLAQVQAKAGDYKSATETVRRAILLAPDEGKWRVRLAKYQIASGDVVEAAKTVAVVDDRRLQTGLSPEMQAELTSLREQIRPRRRDGETQSKG